MFLAVFVAVHSALPEELERSNAYTTMADPKCGTPFSKLHPSPPEKKDIYDCFSRL
jgi:hypothetical protein